MRKISILLLAATLVLMLFGCNTKPAATEPVTTAPVATDPVTEPPETQPDPTQPEETEPLLQSAALYGIDVSGMTAEEAKAAINDVIANYTLTLKVNSRNVEISSQILSLTLSEEAFDSWFQQTVQGGAPSVSGLISFDTGEALSLVRGRLETGMRNASVVYSSGSQRFEIQSHRDGTSADLSTVKSALVNAVGTLSPTATAYAVLSPVPAKVLDTDPRLPAAVDSANRYLELNLSYTYEAPGITTTTKALTKSDLSKFITIGSDFTVGLSAQAIERYVKTMSQRFGSTSGDFITTHGTAIDFTVEYYGAVLDQKAMCADLTHCLENKISGNRSAVFLSSSANNMPYGGNYVEIDLTSQYLWLYRNGELVISTPFVSGNVSGGRRTPTGVFSIFGMYTDTYLMGPTWYDYVNYWIPFYGGIGLHDASWRDEFGGSIYMYDGSHGCINLPNYAAGVIYDNVSIGTMVIVYGGVRSVSDMEQVLTGTTSYDLTLDSALFKLDVTAKYNGVDYHYSSSDPNVVTVDGSGVVTVVGAGTAQITVITDEISVLSQGTLVISVTVEDPNQPDDTEPEDTEPEVTEPDETEPEESQPTEPEPTEPEPTEPTETAPEATEPPKQEELPEP